MRKIVDLLRHEPRASVFFGALAQSSLGTGASYVALLLVAYDRFESPWAISLVLAADLLPAMLLGPIFGALADRFSRRACTVLADLLRAIAFVGIALVDGFATTVALATLAGAGTGLFSPAALSALPSLVERRRLPAATALYGAIADLGFTVGPALAAVLLIVAGPEDILLLNGITFAASAVALRLLAFGAAPRDAPATTGRVAPALVRDAREGVRVASGLTGIRTVLFVSSLALFFAGAFNVGELLFTTQELGAGETAFSTLVAVFGVGFIAGSLSGAGGGEPPELKRRFLAGLAFLGAGYLACGLTSSLAAALCTFAIAGFGNGLVIVYERLLIQATVPDAVAGRVFGLKDALSAWAFALSFAGAAAMIQLTDVRTTIIVAGAGGIAAWVAAVIMLRRTWSAPSAGGDAPPAAPPMEVGA